MLKATFNLIPAGEGRSLPGVRITISSDKSTALEYVRSNLLSRLEGINVNNADIRTLISVIPGLTYYVGGQSNTSFNVEVHLIDMRFARQVADIVLSKVKELYDEYISFETQFEEHFNPSEIDLEALGENTSSSDSSENSDS